MKRWTRPGPERTIVLHRRFDYSRRANLDRVSGHVECWRVPIRSIPTTPYDDGAEFDWIEGRFVAFYRSGDTTYVRVDEREIPLSDAVRSELVVSPRSWFRRCHAPWQPQRRKWTLWEGDVPRVTLEHLEPRKLQEWADVLFDTFVDFTAWPKDREDYDLILWIHELLSSASARACFVDNIEWDA